MMPGRHEEGDGSAGEVSEGELIDLVQSLPHGSACRERACELLLARYRHIVRSAVARYAASPDLAEELAQVGYLGLMKAITNFDPAVGESLTAYAQPCVTGEIKRHFRDKRWQVRVGRPAQELRLELRAAAEELTQELARAPTDAELAARLEVSPEEVTGARVSGQAFHATSLDAPVAEEEDAATLGELLGGEDRGLELALDMEALRTHWQELTGQEQELLLLRFYGNMTQTQIAQRLGVSQMQVSRLLRRVLAYLRDRISGPVTQHPSPAGAGAGPVTGAGPADGPVPRRRG